MIKNSFYIIIVFSFYCCNSNSFKDVKALEDFVADENNNLRYTKKVNGVNFEVEYRPTDLMINQELSQNYTLKNVKELRTVYNKHMYFLLSMSKDNKELLTNASKDREEFGQMFNNLAFGMEQKVNLFTKKNDTITMSDYIYPRLYGISNKSTLLIAYPRLESNLQDDYLNLTIGDLGLSTGEVRFKIQTKPIINEPKIDFSK